MYLIFMVLYTSVSQPVGRIKILMSREMTPAILCGNRETGQIPGLAKKTSFVIF